MTQKRPNVIPTEEMIAEANKTGGEISNAYENQMTSGTLPPAELMNAQNNLQQMEGVKTSSMHGGAEESAAAIEMKRRTQQQMAMRESGQQIEQSLSWPFWPSSPVFSFGNSVVIRPCAI